MIAKTGNKEWKIADDAMVEPWLTLDETDNSCRIELSDAWGTNIDVLQGLFILGLLNTESLFVIPRIVFMKDGQRHVYNSVFVEKSQRGGNTYLSLSTPNTNMEVGN